jgi:S1-C subfamily serine protease
MPPGLRPERMRDAPAVFTPPPPRPAGAPSSMLGENELAYLLVEAVTVIDDAALRERLIAGVIEPVFVGFAADRSGAVYSGFLVGDAGEWSLGELLGLRRGDLVIKANAAVLDGPGKWTEFIETISMDRKLDMDVLRDGRIEKLHYEVR